MKPLLTLAHLLVGLALAGAQPSTPHYGVIGKWQLGGEGGWDYLTADSNARRLYVSRGSHVMVVDMDSGKLIGDLPNTNGVHGVALVDKLGKGFTSNGRDNTVTVFDLKTLKETGSIPVGNRPDAITYDKASNRIFTFNGGSSDATAIDPKTEKVVGTVKLDGKPEFPASDGRGSIFVNIEDKGEIQKFDSKTLQATGSWSLEAESPSGLAMDPERHLLFSTCDNGVMAISDFLAGKKVGAAKIGDGPDAALFDPKMDLAFSSNGADGTLTVLRRQADGTYASDTVQTQTTARTMALDTRTHRIFLAAATILPADPNAQPGERRRQMAPGSFTIVVVGPLEG